MQPHFVPRCPDPECLSRPLYLKRLLGALPLQVNSECSSEEQGPCFLRTPDLDLVCVLCGFPGPSSSHPPGDGTSAAWTLVLLSLSRPWGLLGFCISGLYLQAALYCEPHARSAPSSPSTQPPAPEPACL